MSKYPANPVRLVELPEGQEPDPIGSLIRSARAEPSEETPTVQWRVRNTVHLLHQRRRRVLRFALVSVFIFVAGGVAGAALLRSSMLARVLSRDEHTWGGAPARHSVRRRLPVQSHVIEAPGGQAPSASVESETPNPTGAPAAVAPAPPAPAQPPLTSAPSAVAGHAQSAPSRVAANHLLGRSSGPSRGEPPSMVPSRPAVASLVPAPVMPPTAPVPGGAANASASATLSEEQALIAKALHGLRSSREPEAALAALDEYRRRFPAGSLAPEAARLRTEALLLLGRKTTLLDDLDRLHSVEIPASDERLVLRGELRAAVGRWQSALADFDAVVRAGTGSGTEADDRGMRERLERALWGRSSARSHLGDDGAARTDLREYLRRFPGGRFSAEARRLLDEQP